MSTEQNLQEAFAGESQANRKYLAFAKKADNSGQPGIAKLFRAAAAAETVHALAHLRVLGGIKDTAENLKEAIAGEGFEFQQMYPKMIEEAVAEGNKAAEITFKNANAVEEVHHAMYSEAAEVLAKGSDVPATKMVVCGICGNTIRGDAPDCCQVCGAPGERFFEVE
jgi:rubrerythrin